MRVSIIFINFMFVLQTFSTDPKKCIKDVLKKLETQNEKIEKDIKKKTVDDIKNLDVNSIKVFDVDQASDKSAELHEKVRDGLKSVAIVKASLAGAKKNLESYKEKVLKDRQKAFTRMEDIVKMAYSMYYSGRGENKQYPKKQQQQQQRQSQAKKPPPKNTSQNKGPNKVPNNPIKPNKGRK